MVDYLWEKVLLYCKVCKTITVHSLSHSGDFYACGCGEIIKSIDLFKRRKEN